MYNNGFGLIAKNKDIVINLLLSEIIFLKRCTIKAKSENEKRFFNFASKKFDFLSNVLHNCTTDLSDKDYEHFLTIIYRTIEDVYRLM